MRDNRPSDRVLAWRRRYLELYKRAYDATSNPVFAWHVYGSCRGWEMVPPEWVWRYLDDVAVRVYEVSRPGSVLADDPVAAVFDALGMRSPGPGRWTRGSILSKDDHDLFLASEVQWRREEGHQETYAIDDVARLRDVSPSTVRLAWKRFKDLFSDLPPVL